MSGRLQLILATKETKKKSYQPIIDLVQDSSREVSVFEDQYSCEVFKRFLAYQHIFCKCEGNYADFVCSAMSPLLRDVKEEINNQARSRTSEQDEATFGCRRPKARIPWNFSLEKSKGNCHVLPHVSFGPNNQQYFHFILPSIPFAENAKSGKITQSSIPCFKFILKPKDKQQYQTNLLTVNPRR